MSANVPKFDHLSEYARYGAIMPGALKQKIVPMYPWKLEILVLPDDFDDFPFLTKYSPRVRGFLYHHGFRGMEWNKNYLVAQHILSASAVEQLWNVIWDKKDIVTIYWIVAHMMNHDMLHGFSGEPRDFTQFDEQLIFWGVEFFPLMAHSDIVGRWIKRDSNEDFLMDMCRSYIELLRPLAEEYSRTHDEWLLRLLDYFVLIYQKCLLTFLPLHHNIVQKFNWGVNKFLHPNLPPCIITRERCEMLMKNWLDNWSIKNNYTISADPSYDRHKTWAALAAQDLINNQIPNDWAHEVVRVIRFTLENLVKGWCFRMVPNMPRPANLQKKFQKIYMKK